MTDEYLIRKNGYWYRPNANGYTSSQAEAGRFTLEEAIRHSHPNGPNGPRDGITYEPAPPCLTAQSGEGRSGAGEDARLHDIADKIIAAVKADDDCRGRGKFEVMQILAALNVRQAGEGERLRKAAQRVLDGLNRRIEVACEKGKPVPIFDGIADLHTALAALRAADDAGGAA